MVVVSVASQRLSLPTEEILTEDRSECKTFV
jgi:hypothetical protein